MKRFDKDICLYDAIHTGHHKNFIVAYAKSLIELDCSVTIIFPNSEVLIQEFNQNEINLVTLLDFKPKRIPENRFKIIARWNELKYNLKFLKNNPDLVFVMWLDDFKFHNDHRYILKAFKLYLDHFFKFKWFGINIHQVHFRNQADKLSIAIKESVLSHRGCKGVGIFDEGIETKYKSAISNNLYILPDITNISLCSKTKDIKRNRQIILPGVANKRKGVIEFLSLAEKPANKNWKFIIAGELIWDDFTSKEKTLIKKIAESPNIEITGYLEREEDLNCLINESDLVYAIYLNFPHSSNIMTKAAAFNKPILVNDGYLMSERVKKFGIGLTQKECQNKNLDEILADTQNLNASYNEIFANHTQSVLKDRLNLILQN
ncbi:glycosyltransferase [Crocinitomicaceae bacterium]|nr:glycosyltransferase [Crocinitomicaceae bacterium]